MRLPILAMVIAWGIAAATPSTPTELAQGLQRKYDTVKDFSTDFVHVYEGGVLHKRLVERGSLLIKKPGKMKWQYTSPERKTFVSDGLKIYSYIPEDKQVTIASVPPDDEATTPALFLAGKGNLTRDFTLSAATPPASFPTGTLALKLVPKRAQPDYDWLVLAFEPVSYRLQGLITMDAQGGTATFTFTNLKENVGIADKEFDFKPPRGVDVINDSPRR